MNEWLVAATALMILFLPAGLLALRGDVFERLVGMQLASTIGTLALVVLAQGFDRDVYFDLAIVIAVLSFVGTLFYVHSLDSWL